MYLFKNKIETEKNMKIKNEQNTKRMTCSRRGIEPRSPA